MKLECPSCHQKYRLTNQTIPTNKASVSCRVCTKPIPLKAGSATPDKLARSAQSVACGYCGKKVGINAVQATDSREIDCPSCKHPIQISNQKASPSVAARPAFDAVHLTCSQCQQAYTLNRAKIPANAASATCKACGNKIPIPGSLAKHHSPDQQTDTAQADARAKSKAIEAETQDAAPVSFGAPAAHKKTWARAMLALMLAALIGFGIWFGGGWLLDMFKTGWEVLIESKPRPTMKTPTGTFSSKPLMTMRLNGPLVMHAVKGRLAQNSVHHKSLAVLNTVGVKSVEVFMLPQSEMLAVPAMYIKGKEVHHLKKLVAGYNLFEKSMHKAGAGQYVFDPAAIGKKYGKDYPEIPYTIWFHNDAILVAPEVLMKDPAVTLSRLKAARVSDFAGDLTSHRQAGTIAVKIPKTLENDWPVKLRENPALQVDPRLAMATGMGSSILLQLGEALSVIDMMGANLTVTGEERLRQFHYRQRFRSRSAAKTFKSQLETGDLKKNSTQWLIREMLRLFQDRRIEYTFTLESRDLAVKVNWLPDHDQLIMNALIRAMFGEVVEPKPSGTVNMAPSAETVRTITTVMPQYALMANHDQLKSQIEKEIQERLFPGQYWDGKEPRMTVDLDTIQFTNNTLTKMTYEILSVTSRDGKDVMRRSDEVIEHNLKPADPSPGFVAIGVKAGTAPESLHSADIRFHLKVPTRLHEIEFSTIDPAGKASVAGNIPVKLKRMEKDIAEISYKENPGVFMFAYDRAGNALAISESAQTGNRITQRYHGIIWRLKVLVIEKQLELPLDLTVDLNGGQAYQLAHKPETPPRYRFDHRGVEKYKELNEAALNNLKVKWHEGSETEWFDSLSIDLPEGPIHGRADWDVNFFSHDQPAYLSGKRSDTSHKISYTFDKGALRKVNAATGRVAMRVSTQIERQKFVKSTDKTPVIKKYASGKIVTVIFDQNEVTMTPFDVATVQIIAYDANNRRLKRDVFSQNKGKMRKFYYWGVPTSVEVDIAAGHIKKLIDFDIVKRPLNPQAYENYKQQLAAQQEVVVTLKEIAAARSADRNHYGDDVAGLYYLYNRKQKSPMHLIEKAVAHSDPAGAERFGFPVQPYKGYYFSVLSGVEINGDRQAFPRSKRGLSVYWEKGTFKAANYHSLPTVTAIPVDKSQPTFFIQSGRVFLKRLNGADPQYLPEDPFGQGWVEVSSGDQ